MLSPADDRDLEENLENPDSTINQTSPSPLSSRSPLSHSAILSRTCLFPATLSSTISRSETLSSAQPHGPKDDIASVQSIPPSSDSQPLLTRFSSQSATITLSDSEPSLPRSDTQFTTVPPSETLPSSQSCNPDGLRVTPDICSEPGIEGSIELSSLPSSTALPQPDETANVILQRLITGYQSGGVGVKNIE